MAGAHQYNLRGYVFGYEKCQNLLIFDVLKLFLMKRSCQHYSYVLVRYGDLRLDTLVSYRIQAHKKAGLIVCRSGIYIYNIIALLCVYMLWLGLGFVCAHCALWVMWAY